MLIPLLEPDIFDRMSFSYVHALAPSQHILTTKDVFPISPASLCINLYTLP